MTFRRIIWPFALKFILVVVCYTTKWNRGTIKMLALSHIFTIVSDMCIRGGWQGRGPLGWCHCWQSWSVTWCQMSSPSSGPILQWTRMMSCSPGNPSYWSLENFTGKNFSSDSLLYWNLNNFQRCFDGEDLAISRSLRQTARGQNETADQKEQE